MSNGWVKYAESINITDEELLKFLGDVDSGKRHMKDIDNYMSVASSSASKFALTLKNIALNAGIMIAVTLGIKAISFVWDKLNNTVEEQTQKINDLKSSYEGLKSEYETLSQKQDLTDAEKRRLEYLERRLELDQRILEAEEKMLFEEKYGNKFTDRFDENNYNTQYEKERRYLNEEGFIGTSAKYEKESNRLSDIQAEIQAEKKLQAEYEKGSWAFNNIQKRIDKLTEKETESLNNLASQENQLTINLGRYEDMIESIQSDLDSGNLTGEEKTNAEALLKSYTDMRDTTQGMISSIQQFNIETGKTKDIVEETAEAMVEITPKWDFSTTISNLDTAKEKLSVLDETYSKLFDGDNKTNIGFEDLSAINEAFSDVDGIDNYIKRLQEAGSNTEQVTVVMEDLIDAYLQQSGVLANVTDENKDLVISMLGEMGIANATEIVTNALYGYAEAQRLNTAAGYDLANATAEEIYGLTNIQAEFANAGDKAYYYYLNKKLCSETSISTVADCEALIALAKQCQVTGENLVLLNKLKNSLSVYNDDGGAVTWGQQTKDLAKAEIDKLKAELSNLSVTASANVKVDTKPTWKPKDSAGTKTAQAAEKASDAMNKTSKEAEKSAKSIDYFEERIKKLDNALSLLDANLENVQGSLAKNSLVDAQIGLNAEKVNNYTSALTMYTNKANEALSKLPADIAEKLKNGAVSIGEYIDDEDGNISEAISNYQKWADKINECQVEVAKLREELEKLELLKFENVAKDFEDKFDIRENSKNTLDAYVKYYEESGELVGRELYETQKEQSEKQLKLLEEKQKALVNQLNSALNSGYVEVGSEAWLEMVNSISAVEKSIADCKTEIEGFDNVIQNIRTDIFNRVQKEFDAITSEISNLIDLFEDAEVVDDNANWTSEGLAQLGLYAQQYELAQHRASQYKAEIEILNQDYLDGKYSATEYQEKLAELTEGQWDAVKASEAAKDGMVELNEIRVEKEIESIEKEIDAYKELIDAQKEALDSEKDLHDYRKSIQETTKSKEKIEKQLAAMALDDSAYATAQKAKLREQLAEVTSELEEKEYDHSIKTQKDALDKQYEEYEKSKNSEIETLKKTLTDTEALVKKSFETVKANSETIGVTIETQAKAHGVTVSNAVITPWENGSNAIASYGTTLTEKSSAFISELASVESKHYELQSQADATAVSLANAFGTQADTLVTELTNSYTSTSTLNTMAQTLRDSFVSALESGYDTSGIVSALNSIASAASEAADAFRDMHAAADSGGTYENKGTYEPKGAYGDGTPYQNAVDHADKTGKASSKTYGKYVVVDRQTNDYVEGGLTKEEAEKKYGGSSANRHKYKITAYAKGTHNAKGGIAITDEEGEELKLPKLANGNYSLVGEGTQILTAKQTEMLRKWSELNPVDIIPNSARNMVNDIQMKQPQVVNRNVSNPTLEFNGTLMHIDKVDSTNIKQMENIANKAVDRLVSKMSDGLKYRNF